MKNMLKKIAGPVGAIIAGALPLLAQAQTNPFPLPNSNLGINNVIGSNGILCKIAGLFFTILVILAVIFVIVAAFKYLTAGGEAEKVKSANYQLVYAAVAIIVAVIARSLPNIVTTFVGTTTINGGC